MPKSIYETAKSDIPKEKKVAFYEKELRGGRTEIFKGMKKLKKAIHSVGKKGFGKRLREANIKINKGRKRVIFAKRNLIKLKGTKFWK